MNPYYIFVRFDRNREDKVDLGGFIARFRRELDGGKQVLVGVPDEDPLPVRGPAGFPEGVRRRARHARDLPRRGVHGGDPQRGFATRALDQELRAVAADVVETRNRAVGEGFRHGDSLEHATGPGIDDDRLRSGRPERQCESVSRL